MEKRRCTVEFAGRPFSVDLFTGALAGLAICEAEAPTRDDIAQLRFPPWAAVEITGDAAFSGAALATCEPRTTLARARALLAP